MKTLDEHNREYPTVEIKTFNAGVLCPKCGVEMFYENPGVVLMAHPPQMEVECECGYTGYKII